MTARSVSEALANCARTKTWTPGMCGQFCAAMYGQSASGYRSALVQWQSTPAALRSPASAKAPAGALYFWGGGSQGFGHVAVADGAGGCWSIDIGGRGTVSRVPVGRIASAWGMPFLGWAYPYFSGKVWSPTAMIYGQDVSAYQPKQFALTLPAGGKKVDFVFIKVTEGTGWVSPVWRDQLAWARQHDLVVGFYHFARPGSQNAQIDFFLRQLSLKPGDMLMYDWEDPGISGASKDAAIKYLKSKTPGHKTLLYCNTSYWKTKDTTSYAGDGLWIATGGIPAGSPPIQSDWVIHQYSTQGSVDHDVAQFDSRASMKTWAGGEDEDVALTQADIDKIADTVVTQLTSADGFKKLMSRDNVLTAPADASNADTYWTWGAHVQATTTASRAAARDAAKALVLVQQLSDALAALNVGDLASELEAKLGELKFRLEADPS